MNNRDHDPDLSDEHRIELQNKCSGFEKALERNERPSIENQVDSASNAIRHRLFDELLLLEFEFEKQAKRPIDIDGYLKLFPTRKVQVRAAIDAFNSQLTPVNHNETRFLASSGKEPVDLEETRAEASIAPGVQIGSYTLLEPIGEGGMGLVWKAEQRVPVRRFVALKIIKAGMDTREVIARFEAERQALALMSHPNIAKVFDAGATKLGRPYFVMELVNGAPITEFCDRIKMTADDRIQLFMEVCFAVQHAHQRGVIHRDIKPSNVLVAMNGGKPLVKVIDFGLAKAISQKLTEKTLFTAVGQIVGTPAYMSPEQVERGGLDVDTRTDVYSLGVLLYELLTGVTPIDMKALQSAGYAEMIRMIRENEPPRMRQRISSLGANSKPMAVKRDTDVKRLCRRLQGDLDVIVMNALAKEPNRRYSSPNDFADDLKRFLNREPIEARPASAIYRFKKLAERNKGKFVAAGLLLLALVGGFIGTALGLIEANRQTVIAQNNLVAAEENYELARVAVESYFTKVSDNQLLNEPYMDGLRRELLTSAREFYHNFVERRQDDPDAMLDLATAHYRLGGISAKMGDHDQAMIEIESCRSAAKQASESSQRGESERLQIDCDIYVAESLMKKGEYNDAIDVLDGAIEMANTASQEFPDLNKFKHKSAILLQTRGATYLDLNQQEKSESDYLASIALLEGLIMANPNEDRFSRDLANSYEKIGTMIHEQERMDEAKEFIEKSVGIWRERVKQNKDHVDSLHGLANSLVINANILRRELNYDEAVVLGEEAAKIGRKLVANHPELVTLKNSLIGQLGNLSVVYKVAGRQVESDALNLETMGLLAAMSARFPDDLIHSLRLGSVQGNEGNSKFSAGKWLEAIAWYDRSNESLQVLLDKSNVDPRARQIARNNHWGRADSFTKLQQYDNAVAAFDTTIEMAAPRAHPEIQLERAFALIKNDDVDSAVSTVEDVVPKINLELLGRDSNVALIWFKTGSVLAEVANSIDQDPELKKDQANVAKAHREKAITYLRKAYDFGYFKKQKSKPLETERFKSFGENPAFQSLLKDAELETEKSTG